MKKMKKIVSLLLTAIMVLMMSVNVFAASTNLTGPFTITLNTNETGHQYVAYQIFKGTLSLSTPDTASAVTPSVTPEASTTAAENGKYILSNVEWGDGVDLEKEVDGKKLSDLYSSVDKAVDALESATEVEINAFAKTIAGYLNETNVKTASTTSPYTFSGLSAGYYLIKDKDDSLSNATDRSYTRYMLQVVKNVTVEPKSAVPTVVKKVKDANDSDASDATNKWMDSADYDIGDSVPFQLTATLPSNLSYYNTYKIVFHDTLSKGLTYENITSVKVGNTTITQGYTPATVVNEDGTTSLTITFDNVKTLNSGSVGNNDTIVVEYNATLNTNAVIGSAGNPNKVYLEYSNNPNQDTTNTTPETGKTPEDTVIVFTYQLVINKIDQDKNPLLGAEFTLKKKLADGTLSAAIAYTTNTAAEDATDAEKAKAGTVFTFAGIDAGTYVLSESKTPDGYNTIDDITFKIEATHDETADAPTLTELKAGTETGSLGTITLTGAVSTGALTGNIENRAGDQLPTTGGMGTTIFTITGSILALGAAILLVTKKRMDITK
jgi:fimbrial isopeptide formation D2 family protein/LPXTG-motif cell wall-anchored protein